MKTGAVVLAAGAGDMKEFRPLLYVGRKPMIRHIVDSLKSAGAEPIVVVTGCRGDSLRRLLADSGVELAENRHYARGEMFDSVLIGLRALSKRCERVIIMPADVPLVRDATLAELLRCEGDAVRPVYNGETGHPLILSSRAISLLEGYTGDGGLRGAIQELDIELREIPVDDEAVILDVNTREEYERVIALRHSRTNNGELHMEYNLQLAVDDVIMNNELMHLLEMVECTGSLQTASECVDSSYSKSWRQIRELERQLGVTVLRSAVGGSKGGGSRLTEEGKALLTAYESMQKEGKKLMELLFREHFPKELVEKIQKKN